MKGWYLTMAGRPPVLPDPDGLARLRRRHHRSKCPIKDCSGQKHTYQEIADGFGVSYSAVYQAMRKAQLTDEGSRTDNTDTIPWKLKAKDRYTPIAMRLRILGQIRRGDQIAEEKRRLVVKWVTELIDTQTVITYSEEGGWSTDQWQPGDADILRPPDTAGPEVYSHPQDRKIWSQDDVPASVRRKMISKRQTGSYPVTTEDVLEPKHFAEHPDT